MTSTVLDVALKRGATAFGAWVRSSSDLTVELLASVGFDYIVVDCQHSLMDEADACRRIAPLVPSPVAAFVRVSRNDGALIGRVLDGGADAVIVPMVESVDEAAQAVGACRFPPVGCRSWGPLPGIGTDPASVEARARCFVMIESVSGLANLRSICQTPGLGGIYVGLSDLAIGLGTSWRQDPRPAEVLDACRAIVAESNDAGIIPAIHAGSGAVGAWFAAFGFALATICVDTDLVMSAGNAELRAASDGAPSPAGFPAVAVA